MRFTLLGKPAVAPGVVVLTNLSNNKDGTMPADELAKIVVDDLSRRGR